MINMTGKGKGWYGQRQQHAMASKGVRSGKVKQFGAKGVKIIDNPDGYPDFTIDEHYWGFERNGDSISIRLGNWSDAGWYWHGDEDDLAGFLIRLGGVRGDEGKNFVEMLTDYGIDFNEFKELILESARSGNGVYMITGDNVKWHFGQDGEREYDILRYDIPDNENLSEKEAEVFEEYYWMEMDSSSTDFDTFEKSEYYNDLIDEIVSVVENADSWEDVLEGFSDVRDVGEEASYEFSDNAVRGDIYEKFETWSKTDRWDKEVESGLPDDETIGNLINNFGRIGTMKKILKNYWDVESLDEAKNLVKQYEKDAIPKGRRKIEKEQHRMGDF